jgi:hypothetical protein
LNVFKQILASYTEFWVKPEPEPLLQHHFFPEPEMRKDDATLQHCLSLLPDGRIYEKNNSKEAPKNCQWPEKIGGRKMAEFDKKRQKRGRKIFYNDLGEKPYNNLYFL